MPESELLDTYLQIETEWRKLPPLRDHDGITFKRSRFIDSWDVEIQPLVREYLKKRTLATQLFFKKGYQGSGLRGTELYQEMVNELIAELSEE